MRIYIYKFPHTCPMSTVKNLSGDFLQAIEHNILLRFFMRKMIDSGDGGHNRRMRNCPVSGK